MQTNKKIALLLVLPALIFLCTGCKVEKPVEIVVNPEPARRMAKQPETTKRFQQPAQKGLTVVESAMELSTKYTKLTEQMVELKEQNQQLLAENQHLKERLLPCQEQLNQTQKELTEANDLLVEMHIELNNWKTDILGFRNELREADKAQLETLLRILKVLGGEIKTEQTHNTNEAETATPSNKAGRPQDQSPLTGTTSGQSNG